MKINKQLAIIFFLFVAVLISYINIFPNEFVLDDIGFIVENIHTKDIENIHKFFGEPSIGNLYRPLRSVFYIVTYQIWNLNVFGYHLNSLILHFFVTIILFFITLKITKNSTFSFVVALFFAVHPIHTVRVTSMTAAFDIYGILFMLLSFYFYILASNKKHYYFLSILFYVLALFSSEEAITLILILLLYDISFNYKINFNMFKLLFKKYLPYIIVSIFYLIVRFAVLQQVGRVETYFKESFLITQLTTVKVFANYIILLFFPYNVAVLKNYTSVTSILNPVFLLSLFALSSIIFFTIKSYKMSEFSKKNSEHTEKPHGFLVSQKSALQISQDAQKPLVFDKSKMIFFSIGFFFITLLPFSNIFPQLTLMADRYLYLPSYGFCIFLTFIIFKLKKIEKKLFVTLIIIILGVYTFLTIQTNTEWRDQFSVLNYAIEKNKGKGTMAHAALAEYYIDYGDYDNAIKYSQNAINLLPNNFYAYKNLGRIYAELKNYSLAIHYYKRSLEMKPDLYQSYNNIGLIYSYVGDFNNSVFYLKKTIEVSPKLSKAHHDIATVYAQIGEFELAEKEFKKAIEINPYDKTYKENYESFHDFLTMNKIT